jgi:NAD(P) transhydrogenase subunit alpha
MDVRACAAGSVIVDMAAEQGGNCELTVPGEAVVRHGVTIVGYTDLASRLAKQSSTLYSTNLLRLTEELAKAKDGTINVNFDDDAIRGLTVLKQGEVTWPAPPPKLPAVPPKPKASAVPAAPKGHGEASAPRRRELPRSRFWSARRFSPTSARTRRPRSSRISRCSCWRVSSATW